VAKALDLVPDIMEFKLYPYGNARYKKNLDGTYAFTCQHGREECEANMYMACAIEHTNGTTIAGAPKWWPFVDCLDRDYEPVSVAKECAQKTGVDWSLVLECAGSDPTQGSKTDGNPLMYSIAQATENLVPAHQFTPWVVLNGKPLSSSKLDKQLVQLVCDAYQGDLPAGCN